LKSFIKSKALELISLYGTRDPYELCECLCIEIWERPLNKTKGLFYSSFGFDYILLKEDLSDEEKRVVIAHEIAHQVLHRHLAAFTEADSPWGFEYRPEREANLFVAELLLSDDFIEEHISFSKEQLAILAGIPQQYVDLKLELMGRERS